MTATPKDAVTKQLDKLPLVPQHFLDGLQEDGFCIVRIDKIRRMSQALQPFAQKFRLRLLEDSSVPVTNGELRRAKEALDFE